MTLFRSLLFFVKRKALEYCECLLNAKYTNEFYVGIIEQLKKRNESLTALSAAGRKTNENFGKQPHASQLAQMFCDSARRCPRMIQHASGTVIASHRAREPIDGTHAESRS
jgi:hypothetical protein